MGKADGRTSGIIAWVVLGLLLLITLLSYVSRMSLSVALPSITESFGWSHIQQGRLGGVLLGIFLVSYGFSNIFLSPYIDRFGAKVTLTASALLTAVSLVLSGLFGDVYIIFILARLLLGLAQGVVFPSASQIITRNFSLQVRSRANSIFISGAPLGSLLTPLVITPIIIAATWQIALYASAVLALLCIPPIYLLFTLIDRRSATATVPAASNANFEGKAESAGGVEEQFSIRTLLADPQFRIILASNTGMMCVWWGLSLWLPTYLVEAKGFALNEMKYGAAFIYIGAAAGLYTGSWISDKTGLKKRLISGALISTFFLFIVLTTLPIESKLLGVVLTFLVFFVLEMSPPIFYTIVQSKIPASRVGAASGLLNGTGNAGGILGPVGVGFAVSLTGSYAVGLMFLGLCALLAGLTLLLWYRDR